jgi:hypothetical protein
MKPTADSPKHRNRYSRDIPEWLRARRGSHFPGFHQRLDQADSPCIEKEYLVKRRSRPRLERAGALLLVVLSVTVALIAGITLMAGATTTTAISVAVVDHAQSRQIAESGLALTLAYIDRTPTWRDEMSGGAWVQAQSLLAGDVSINAAFGASAPDPTITDPSFEDVTDTLPTPPESPPMSGAIGAWTVERTALVESGASVPLIGTRASASATQGANEGFIAFEASITGSGAFRQDLGVELEPTHLYELIVDITPAGVPPMDASFGFRLYAGDTLLATTEEALTSFEDMTPEEVEENAEELQEDAEEPATLAERTLAGGGSEYTLRFITSEDPTPGPLVIELFAESVGISSEIAFDNVRLRTTSNEVVRLTASGRRGVASHASVAGIVSDLAGRIRLVEWTEP